MRVLVVVPRYVSAPGDFYQLPLGLAYITAALKQAGHQVAGINLNHRVGPTEQLVADAVRAHGAEVCATGSLSSFLPEVKRVFIGARSANRQIINIAGGGVVSSDPEVGPSIMDIDYGVVGEGEVTICDLLDTLWHGKDPAEVKGIVYRNRTGEIVQTPHRPPVMDLTQFARPDYDTLEYAETLKWRRPLDEYYLQAENNNNPRPIDVISSRSCPYSCTFCFHPIGKVYRERPLDEFFSELNGLVEKYQVNTVTILDELFSLRRARLLEFCERIKPLGVNWLVQLHPHSADPEVLKAMRDSGCMYISYGIESMSPPVLVSMQKKSKRERIEQTLKQTFDAKIGIQGNVLFGDTVETLETANETMSWWANNRQYQVYLSQIQVYPGSPDYIVAVRDGMIADRAKYAEELTVNINIANINDVNREVLRFQADTHNQTLMNVAPIKSFRKSAQQIEGRHPAYDIVWTCPRCDHINAYQQCVVRPDQGKKIRILCRSCRSRWDIQNYVAYGTLVDGTLNHDAVRGLLQQQTTYTFRKHVDPVSEMHAAGVDLREDPFAALRHVRFADALVGIGALAAARLHYEQAIQLMPNAPVLKQRLAALLARPDYVGKEEIYFVSLSNDPPRYRRSRDVANYERKREPAFPVYGRAGNRESVYAEAAPR